MEDKITLAQLRQIGVEGIVTALHDVPLGEVWTREKIHDLKTYIESYGMRWSVVESLPVVETIKYGGPDRDHQIEVYKESLRNLAAEDIHCREYRGVRCREHLGIHISFNLCAYSAETCRTAWFHD